MWISARSPQGALAHFYQPERVEHLMASVTSGAIATNKDARTAENNLELVAIDNGYGSAWWDKPVDLTKDWSSSFEIYAFNGSGTSDGFTFTINGDSRGKEAIGDGGQNLGFFGFDSKIGIKNSYAILFDMWTTGPAKLLGFAPSSTTAIEQRNLSAPISLTNNSYTANVSYLASSKLLSLTIVGQKFSENIDLQAIVGEKAYLGFTAANGGGTMNIDVKNWDIIATEKSSTPTIRGNSLYTIVDGPSWTQAEANSVKLGGHLVTINSEQENAFLVNNFATSVSYNGAKGDSSGNANYTPRAWIGLSDKDIEGVYKWTSGEEVSYMGRNWFSGMSKTSGRFDPNTGYVSETLPLVYEFIDQDAVNIHLGSDGSTANIGIWDDVWGNHSHFQDGISETPFIRRGDSAYVIVSGPTWEEAEENAVKLGGHLVTINDAEENSFLVDFLNKETELSFYIGATD